MKPSNPRLPPFVSHCVELLSPLGAVRVRRMFGGWGLYVDDVFLAIIADEQLYLKADVAGRVAFQGAGCKPFIYDAKGQSMTLGYWSAPTEAMDSAALMQPWARLAMRAALAARTTKPATKPGVKATVKRASRPKKLPRARAAAKKASGGA